MLIIGRTFLFITWVVTAIIVAVVALMIIRLIVEAADLNPFGWASRTVRRLTDPFVTPMRGGLRGFGIDPKYAPLVVVLITILLGYFALQLAGELAGTAMGLVASVKAANPVLGLGYVLYGALSIYLLLILMRIVFSWGMVSYSNRIMRFLVNTTEPLLGPLRRIVPPLGVFDISPIVAILIIWLFRTAIQGTLLRGGGSLLN
jgi:YggT family protein